MMIACSGDFSGVKTLLHYRLLKHQGVIVGMAVPVHWVLGSAGWRSEWVTNRHRLDNPGIYGTADP